MDLLAPLLDLFVLCALVLVPATVAGLALQRVRVSRSRNVAVYAASALAAGWLAIRILTDILTGTGTNPVLALAAFAAPVGWGVILWVVSSPGGGVYWKNPPGVEAVAGATNPKGRDAWPTRSPARIETQARRPTPVPVFRSRMPETEWRRMRPLPRPSGGPD